MNANSAETHEVRWYDDEHEDCAIVGRHGHSTENPSAVIYDTSKATENDCDTCGYNLLWDSNEDMWYCPNTWHHQ